MTSKWQKRDFELDSYKADENRTFKTKGQESMRSPEAGRQENGSKDLLGYKWPGPDVGPWDMVAVLIQLRGQNSQGHWRWGKGLSVEDA